jgi:peptidoglycan/LPS O-acetylase OafA/YrhL
VDATWGAAMAVLAVVGGATRTIGNWITLALGAVGGACFALASATIPFTDLFDGLFPVASLLGLWAVVVGIMVLRCGPAPDGRRDAQ